MDILKVLLLLSLVLLIGSCVEDNIPYVEEFNNGILIANQGDLNSGFGSISYFENSDSAVDNFVFESVNKRFFDGNLQSISVHNNYIYVVLGSNKIEQFNAVNLVSNATITGFEQPRHLIGIDDNKAYVSQWGNDGLTGSIAVVDLVSNTITKTIATGKGPDKMVKKGSFIYVVNTGGSGIDSTVSVINTATDEIETTVTVGINPNSLDLFGANFLVLCGGDATTAGSVWRVAGFSPGKLLTFDDVNAAPTHLVETSNDEYFCLYKGNIHQIVISGLNFSLSAPIVAGDFNGFMLDLTDNNRIYGFDENSVARYEIDGTVIDNFVVETMPIDMIVN